MSTIKIITTAFLFLSVLSSSEAQYKLERPVSVGVEHGLPTTIVRSVQKSKDGFIWLGTNDGLSRFDGQQVKNV